MADEKTATPPSQNSLLILIVEDDPSLSKMYSTKLQNEGFRVSTAPDGATGLAKAASEHPSLILLDMMLPKYSGIEFLEQLHQHSKGLNTPIIALSNLTDSKQVSRAMSLGVKEYLSKAMQTPDEVVSKIKQHLGVTPGKDNQSESAPPTHS